MNYKLNLLGLAVIASLSITSANAALFGDDAPVEAKAEVVDAVSVPTEAAEPVEVLNAAGKPIKFGWKQDWTKPVAVNGVSRGVRDGSFVLLTHDGSGKGWAFKSITNNMPKEIHRDTEDVLWVSVDQAIVTPAFKFLPNKDEQFTTWDADTAPRGSITRIGCSGGKFGFGKDGDDYAICDSKGLAQTFSAPRKSIGAQIGGALASAVAIIPTLGFSLVAQALSYDVIVTPAKVAEAFTEAGVADHLPNLQVAIK